MAIQRVKSKWAKTNSLVKSEEMRDSIPTTKKWSSETLRSMLNEYKMVYVKPDQGTFGSGVIRVEKLENHYTYQLGTRIRNFSGFEAMAASLQTVIKSRTYLVQRGIHLLKHKGRRFDIRVMVQKNDRHEWESTGIIGRLSHPSKIVTNYHSGGTPMTIERLMQSHLTKVQTRNLKSRLRKLGVSVARQLQNDYPRLKELGVDVAVDTSFKPWILEVNTLPDPFLFRKLPDKRVFRKIYRYGLLYGRFKSTKKRS
ncbi:YheC/YheD family protein [Paenibacillus sepulcri]|uniref:YheC/YheD family protein n=1 Tax=Paenibacillus sepulcri TaxID=359917 RepID=A0ABS7BVD5_9BACL|nr:YheC/YheD family protein [Paenibacillus sepulcri]